MPKEENKKKDNNKEKDENIKLAIKQEDNYNKDKKPFLDQHFSDDFLNDYF